MREEVDRLGQCDQRGACHAAVMRHDFVANDDDDDALKRAHQYLGGHDVEV
jgi:hypothetical protein